jgi:hypothetical protein
MILLFDYKVTLPKCNIYYTRFVGTEVCVRNVGFMVSPELLSCCHYIYI